MFQNHRKTLPISHSAAEKRLGTLVKIVRNSCSETMARVVRRRGVLRAEAADVTPRRRFIRACFSVAAASIEEFERVGYESAIVSDDVPKR